ncbi:hypothetical protein [Streptomyces tibetensis]|uniref:hypothetical protein n=1 Tax=Streptomyces tibetensis TaxID=2382123 RepID=UPI0033FD22B3
MELVELGGDRVRFQRSVVHAQLGARFLNAVIHPEVPDEPREGSFFPAALRSPGRELLIAMVLHSRLPDGACVHDEPGARGPDGTCWYPVSAARDLLMEAACQAQTIRTSGHDNDDKQDVRPLLGRTLRPPPLADACHGRARGNVSSAAARPEASVPILR